jgi:hypothetical protein
MAYVEKEIVDNNIVIKFILSDGIDIKISNTPAEKWIRLAEQCQNSEMIYIEYKSDGDDMWITGSNNIRFIKHRTRINEETYLRSSLPADQCVKLFKDAANLTLKNE